ncbi:hypothetical protein HC928_10670, partial [bacterium]|nr:hypothetical protein [bacterium]
MKRLLFVLLPAIAYGLVLSIPMPASWGLSFRYGIFNVLLTIVVVQTIGIFLARAYKKTWIYDLVLLTFVAILFALPLSGIWNSGISEASFIGGLLPWNDANGYYLEAQKLHLEQINFEISGSRRPMFPGLLAVLMRLFDGNLQAILGILVIFSAVASYCLSRSVHKVCGLASGGLSLFLLFAFYRRYAGTTLTENLGFGLGCLGLLFLLEATSILDLKCAVTSKVPSRGLVLSIVGIFFLSLALNARAGAFFILPAILFWGIFQFINDRKSLVIFIILGVASVLLAFSASKILLVAIGDSDAQNFSNFSTVLYGLVVGGKGWTQVLSDYPGIAETDIYQVAWQEFQRNPSGVVVGALRYWNDYFNPHSLGAFSFHCPPEYAV